MLIQVYQLGRANDESENRMHYLDWLSDVFKFNFLRKRSTLWGVHAGVRLIVRCAKLLTHNRDILFARTSLMERGRKARVYVARYGCLIAEVRRLSSDEQKDLSDALDLGASGTERGRAMFR